MPYDKQAVPAAMEFPTDGSSNRVLDVPLVGCCGLIVAAAPSSDATLVVLSAGQTVSLTLYAPGTGEAVTSYPWCLEMQIDQIVGGTMGTTDGLEDDIILLRGRA